MYVHTYAMSFVSSEQLGAELVYIGSDMHDVTESSRVYSLILLLFPHRLIGIRSLYTIRLSRQWNGKRRAFSIRFGVNGSVN